VVRVKVLEVDIPRKRIALTMRMSDPAEKKPAARSDEARAASPKPRAPNDKGASRPSAGRPEAPAASGALADALRRAGAAKPQEKGKTPRR